MSLIWLLLSLLTTATTDDDIIIFDRFKFNLYIRVIHNLPPNRLTIHREIRLEYCHSFDMMHWNIWLIYILQSIDYSLFFCDCLLLYILLLVKCKLDKCSTDWYFEKFYWYSLIQKLNFHIIKVRTNFFVSKKIFQNSDFKFSFFLKFELYIISSVTLVDLLFVSPFSKFSLQILYINSILFHNTKAVSSPN